MKLVIITGKFRRTMGFRQFNFHDKLFATIQEVGLVDPTPIQKRAIPLILAGRDLRASAETGTGKTAAFVLPALQRLAEKGKPGRGPRILILTPTRELAMQVANETAKFSAAFPHLRTICVFGGVPYPMQNRQLSAPYDILVATPGRLIDHLERQRIDLSRVEMLILDEADRMLDMGFIEPVEYIASLAPSSRQTLLFSATLKKEVLKLSARLLNNPEEIIITPEGTKHTQIEQHFRTVDGISDKHRLLNEILTGGTVNQAIVFTATKRAADELADQLSSDGHDASALHGDMDQRQRTRTIKQLRDGQIKILVATDVAARGIDIATISHVINFDLPMNGEDYVHRIGRTGRAGATGVAFSFASKRDMHKLREIAKYTGQAIPIAQEQRPFQRHKPFRKEGFFKRKKFR